VFAKKLIFPFSKPAFLAYILLECLIDYKNGVLYYARQFHNEYMGKRNDSICCYIQDGGTVGFGQVELFSLDPVPLALIYPLNLNSVSLMQKAGDPCRPILQPYKEIDILSLFFHLC